MYVGADLHKDFRGHGLGYESYVRFLPFLFEEFDLTEILLEVLETNDRAINLYRKLGFVFVDIKHSEVFKNGQWVDSHVMSITKNDLK